MAADAVSAPPVSDERWREALEQVLAEPASWTLHAQPIVELSSGEIAGYELLSRFTGPWPAAPDRWFAAAEQWGMNALLQSRVLRAAIAARTQLPADTFLTVNIDPHLLSDDHVSQALESTTDLSRLVLELTEHTRPDEGPAVSALLATVRAAGARIAMDDAGTGYAGLSTLLTLRPDIVKFDRGFVTGIDQDPVKRALIEVFGDLVGRMDAWVLAEGIETRAELASVIGLGVPLGQGFALARPAATMLVALDADVAGYIRTTAARTSLRTHVASLIRPVSVGTDRDRDDVLLAANGQPELVVQQNQFGRAQPQRWAPVMTVAPSAALTEVARRAMAREDVFRFAPLVCTDAKGTVLGVIRLDDVLTALCSSGEHDRGR